MYFNTASLFLIVASAIQGVVASGDVGDYTWDVTQYQAGLSHGNPADPTTSWYSKLLSLSTRFSCSVVTLLKRRFSDGYLLSTYVIGFTVCSAVFGSLESETYIPAFGALCTGFGAGFPLSSGYSDCAMDLTTSESGASVSARIVPYVDNTQAHIAINYVFSTAYVNIFSVFEEGGGNHVNEANDPLNRDGARNYTATAVTDWARERPPYNFTLSPSEVL